MSIRHQITIILIGLSAILPGTIWLAQSLMMGPAFEHLERASAARDVERCVDALLGDIADLSALANDWGAWNDTYSFVLGENSDYIATNLVDETFTNTSTEFIAFFTTSGDVVWCASRDPALNETRDTTEILSLLGKDSQFYAFCHNNDSATGLLSTPHGPMLLAARPVIPTNRRGTPAGSVCMGRYLNRERVLNLSERTHLSLEVRTLSDSTPSPIGMAGAVAEQPRRIRIDDQDRDTLIASTDMVDIYGRPVVRMEVKVPRDITRYGKVASQSALACALSGCMLIVAGVGVALRSRVVRPLLRMADHVTRVGQSDDLTQRLCFSRSDEIGVLARCFDRMVEQLADSREHLRRTAHQAGKAEITSEILHNVGNAVTTTGCCAELIQERLRNSRLSGLQKSVRLLKDHAADVGKFLHTDPRGRMLIPYLGSLSDTLQQERQENLAEMHRLKETVRHIREAIASQHDQSESSGHLQWVALQSLIDETLLVNEPLRRESGARTDVRISNNVEVRMCRSSVAQVLVNLQRNALLSMLSVPSGQHVLTVSATVVVPETPERVSGDEHDISVRNSTPQNTEFGVLHLDVRDTGNGFAPELGPRLFQHGFTTREGGSGLGLHYCASVIRDMGGALSAESAGPGGGAVFQITVPVAVRFPQIVRYPESEQLCDSEFEKRFRKSHHIVNPLQGLRP